MFEAIGPAIYDHGGSFVMTFRSGLITATMSGTPNRRSSIASMSFSKERRGASDFEALALDDLRAEGVGLLADAAGPVRVA